MVEASGEAVASDYNSVFSRLVLCKTFRLEEDGKVGPHHKNLHTDDPFEEREISVYKKYIIYYISNEMKRITGLEPGGVALSMCSPGTADP